VGYYSVPQGDPVNWVPTDDLFVIGNGGEALTEGEVTTAANPSNAFVVHKNGNVRVAGDIDTKGTIRVKPSGDLSMGAFTQGTNPANEQTGLNAGLRYPTE
jgi:hypothetical protein